MDRFCINCEYFRLPDGCEDETDVWGECARADAIDVKWR